MKNGFKTFCVAVVLVMIGIIFVGCGSPRGKRNGMIPDPGGNFEYNRVLVLLTEEATLLDKAWAPSDFPGFAFSEVVNRWVLGGHRSLIFYLVEPSRKNVLRAIYYLNTKPEVYIAHISGIEYP